MGVTSRLDFAAALPPAKIATINNKQEFRWAPEHYTTLRRTERYLVPHSVIEPTSLGDLSYSLFIAPAFLSQILTRKTQSYQLNKRLMTSFCKRPFPLKKILH